MHVPGKVKRKKIALKICLYICDCISSMIATGGEPAGVTKNAER